MTRKEFNKQLDKGFEKLNRLQKVQFAWRCAIRALPYIAQEGHLKFWNQKEIYDIFNAIDVTCATAYDATPVNTMAADASYFEGELPVFFANAPLAAAFATANAAYAAYAYDSDDPYDEMYNPAGFTAVLAATTNTTQRPKIIKDLDLEPHSFSTESDQLVWANFLKVLEGNGLGFWAEIYQSIFDNDFSVDLDGLRKRLNVPKEIKEQGALKVVHYLE